MVGTIITATVITIEVGLVAYNLHKQGVFKAIKDKYTKKKQYDTKDTTCIMEAEVIHA